MKEMHGAPTPEWYAPQNLFLHTFMRQMEIAFVFTHKVQE